MTQAEADRALEVLLEHGVNHIDTAARDGIRRSLDRLRVDAVDLLQLHSLARPGDWETAMGAGGALEAVIEARELGLTRFIGVTGHGWTIASMHLKSLERFDFDSVLLPWNFVMHENERYRGEFEAVRALAEKRDVAVQAIKSIAHGPWATTDPDRNTWYQPFETRDDIERAGPAEKEVDEDPGPVAGDLRLEEVVHPGSEAVVDLEPVRMRRVDHVAERREHLAAERPRLNHRGTSTVT